MKLRDQDRHTFGMMDRRTAIHAGNFGSKALLDSSNVITVLTNLGANLDNISANVLSDGVLVHYLWNNTSLQWDPISAETPNILPDGITVEGSLTQVGNDLTYSATLSWAWRISGTEYTSVQTVISIPPATSGNRRRDLIYGDNTGAILRRAGTEVPSDETAILPSLQAGEIALSEVDVIDTGITDFINFSLSSFVRFDINNQDLSPVQRLNARTNIQSVSKDTNDTRVGRLTNTGRVTVIGGGEGGNDNQSYLQGDVLYIRTAEDGTASSNMLDIKNGINLGGMTMQKRGSVTILAKGDSLTDYYILRLQGTNNLTRVEVNNSGVFANQRSVDSLYLTRRDENWSTYPTTIVGAGKLNNVALPDANGMIVFSVNVTEVSGIVSNNLDEKELIIWSENPDGLTLTGADTDSDANNRFSETVEIGYRVPTKIIYRAGSINRWFLLSGGTSGGGSNEEWVSPPATSTSTGTQGQKSYDSNFVYFCVATDSWERVAKDTSAW